MKTYNHLRLGAVGGHPFCRYPLHCVTNAETITLSLYECPVARVDPLLGTDSEIQKFERSCREELEKSEIHLTSTHCVYVD
jgi:hypothetical protein